MRLHRSNKKSERGVVTFLTAAGLIFLVIPSVGLAIDAGVAYTIKAKLQTAVDGAAIAAGRSLARGIDVGTQQAAAIDTAKRFFHANFPNNWMGAGTVADPTVTFPTAPLKTVIINITGTVQIPTYFMRIMNWNTMSVSAVGQVTRRDVNVMLVVDRSGSLLDSGSCGAVRSASKSFVDSFVTGRDKLGMVTFGTDYRVDFPLNLNFGTASPTLSSQLNSLVCYGYTNAAAAFWTGYQQLVAENDTGVLNVILFFTDGMPNTVTFGMNGATDNRVPMKSLATPLSNSSWGYDIKNASPCAATPGFTGVLTFISGLYKKDATGYPASQSVDAQKIGPLEGNAGGCIFDSQFNNSQTIYKDHTSTFAIAGPGFPAIYDIAYLPEQDIYGNLTGAGYSGGSQFASVNRYPNTAGWPVAYRGKIRADDMLFGQGGGACQNPPGWGASIPSGCVLGYSDTITNAGVNALDNAARRARADATSRNLGLMVYVIGLGNAPGGVNNSLLERIANDPDSNLQPNSYNAGIYVYSPDATQLNQAFNQIASEVLRLSK
jgi:Flp pilus assembly protein TadG